MKNRYSYALVGGLITLGAVAGCAHRTVDVTACKSAMQKQYAVALVNGTKGTEPAACQGVPTKTLIQLANQILGGPAMIYPVSCKEAMKGTAYASVAAAGDTGTPPPQCKGVSLYQQQVWARQDVLGQ